MYYTTRRCVLCKTHKDIVHCIVDCTWVSWVFSSVGRASRLHREGQRFETVNTQGVQSLCTDILISISGDCAHKCTVCTICVNADIYIVHRGSSSDGKSTGLSRQKARVQLPSFPCTCTQSICRIKIHTYGYT